VCSFSAGTLSFNAAGNCILDANQAGDATYKAAPQQQQPISVWPQSGGTMTRNVAFVSAGSTHNMVKFTFTAPASGLADGSVRLAVPTGWSAPSIINNTAGFSTASTGTISISGRTIVVGGLTLAAGSHLVITYGLIGNGGAGGATAPTTTGAQTWQTRELSSAVGNSGGPVFAASPSITVVAPDGSGAMTANKSSVTHS
jgi:hypothetical protein